MSRRGKGMSLGTFSMLIGFVLCVLKAASVITWPWWAVTAPIWVPFAVFTLFMLFVGGVVGARSGVDAVAAKTFEDTDELTDEEAEMLLEHLLKRLRR
jgi:hypothetical protein